VFAKEGWISRTLLNESFGAFGFPRFGQGEKCQTSKHCLFITKQLLTLSESMPAFGLFATSFFRAS
jgi:hypothetical protein